jgi:dienelactone hydrolase
MKNLALVASFALTSAIALSTNSLAKTQERVVEYKAGAQTFEGFVAMPSPIQKSKKLPGVLIVHNWMGVTEETKSKAREFAKLGYVAFAADIYGKGVRPSNMDEAAKQATLYKTDRKLFRERLNLGLQQLQALPEVNANKIAAAGYCFGGTGALELARSGAKIKGAISFHGGLDSPEPTLGKNIQAQVIAFHGADDPYVPEKDLVAFETEMKSNKVDYQLIKFGNTVHSFTEKAAGNDPSKGAAYQAQSDQRSWSMTREFLQQLF